MSPSQAGAVGAVPGTAVKALPQLSVTIGNVGITMSATQATVAVVGAIAANGRRLNSNGMGVNLRIAFTVGVSPGVYHVAFTSRSRRRSTRDSC